MATLSRESLLAKRHNTGSGFPEDQVDIPSLGGSVTVRGLSRMECLHLQEVKGGASAVERVTLALGVIDPPDLTEDDVKTWQKVADAKELDDVTRRIGELSGMLEDSNKAAHKSDEDGPEPEVRVLPGAEAGDASGEAPAGDE